MQFILRTRDDHDLARIAHALVEIDPAAFCDRDPAGHAIRIATAATHSELRACLTGIGMQADAGVLFQLPSECCGGCGG
ncbi:hypothetical protein [Marilutibacter spongiae]|uniref:Uncharacterized protein n=1 Tax=Marilutibacter spongiae TaxID=2025720 RepID=A0A7W3TML1_9GAMM|nr:hypothetical protein [Lysobacter spongiae]MBB1060819.1 hypothetical protein [Lysobacter spongiae]